MVGNVLLARWLRDRKEAMLSLDKPKIEAYLKKYQIDMQVSSEEVFWADIHKVRLTMSDMPEEEKEKSRAWLVAHNFTEDLF